MIGLLLKNLNQRLSTIIRRVLIFTVYSDYGNLSSLAATATISANSFRFWRMTGARMCGFVYVGTSRIGLTGYRPVAPKAPHSFSSSSIDDSADRAYAVGNLYIPRCIMVVSIFFSIIPYIYNLIITPIIHCCYKLLLESS